MNVHVKRTIQINDDAGVGINKTFQSLVKDARGHENVPFCERDVRNYVNKERRAIGKEGDGNALISYFCHMREQNSDFFYDIDLDDDFHVRNVFWADARSRAAYEYFGDVVSFDTTYLTNKYNMPFAAFVGVNHHGQSTLLGCGLLSGEDTDSFVWLFKSWLRCMLGKAPLGIVTDQCKAMKNAIELVFPTIRHRWCLWHIMKKIPEKLGQYSEYKKIKFALKKAVYDTVTKEAFQEKWCSFIKKFELQ
ncbi:protein FAR1-RELATED SEQUENCE 6-like [Cicer arietinum]|uniref:protein FAR1-RELATED SEQUENCE 6-like n=1 Tax=Cicer arietinum TaxID=3827 RepID=UPI003CC6B227